jgi:hypothetical protein
MTWARGSRPSIVAALAALLGAAGCAPAEAPRPPARSAGLDASLDTWVGGPTGGGAPTRSITLFGPPSQAPAFTGTTTLRDPPAPPSRPRRGRRVDVSFRGADMADAFQLLADAGGFNVVVEDGLAGHVSATLHGVDAYDALVSLAEANGARVAYDGAVVVVKK